MNPKLKLWVNGDIVEPDLPHISAEDRSFLLGDGCFETLRWSNGKIEGVGEHLDNLKRACSLLGIQLNRSDADLEEVLAFQGESLKGWEFDAAIRVTVSRGAGGRGASAVQADPNIVVSASLLQQTRPYAGLSVMTSTIRRNETCPSSRIKSTSYVSNLAARKEAADAGFDEALMLNTQGRVACLAMANIAMVERLTKTIWTPPVEEGVRPGYQRGEVLRMLSKQGWRIAEVPIELEELSCEGREVFGLNSLWGVRPVRKLDRVALLVTEHDLPGA